MIAVDVTQEKWEESIAKDSNAIIIDVRTEDEVEEGYIPNMINIDIGLGQGFLDELEKLDKTKSYYVYCRSGSRSAQACTLMGRMGFKNIYNLVGGFMNWTGEVVE